MRLKNQVAYLSFFVGQRKVDAEVFKKCHGHLILFQIIPPHLPTLRFWVFNNKKGLHGCFKFQGSTDRNLPDRKTSLSQFARGFSGFNTENTSVLSKPLGWSPHLWIPSQSFPCTFPYSVWVQGSRGERSFSLWTSSPIGAVSCKKYSEHCI